MADVKFEGGWRCAKWTIQMSALDCLLAPLTWFKLPVTSRLTKWRDDERYKEYVAYRATTNAIPLSISRNQRFPYLIIYRTHHASRSPRAFEVAQPG